MGSRFERSSRLSSRLCSSSASESPLERGIVLSSETLFASSMQPSASRRSRYSTDQFSRAAAAGCPRSWNSFNGDSQSWNAYQHGWIQQFSPEFELAPVGDSRRRKQWESAVRQWRGIEAARERDGRHAMIASQPDAAVGPTSSSAIRQSVLFGGRMDSTT